MEKPITHVKVIDVGTKAYELEKEVNNVIDQQLQNGYDCVDKEVISFKVENVKLVLLLLSFALQKS